MIFFPSIWFNVFSTIFQKIYQFVTMKDVEEEGGRGNVDDSSKMKMRLWNIFLMLMKVVVISLISVVFLHQLASLNETWSQKIQERDSKLLRWKHDCGDPTKPPMDPDIIEICNQLKVVVDTSPFIRALSKVIYSWNSCVTMPCSDLLNKMSSNLEFKLLAICVAIVIIHYTYRFIGFTKTKSNKLKDYLQTKYTMKQFKKMQQEQQHVLPSSFTPIQSQYGANNV